jgi:hypothetical protein
MLSKCANPACSKAFRYLHERKLFLIESEAGTTKRRSEAALQDTGKPRAIDYVWLCSSCCRDMTVYIDGANKVRVVRKLELPSSRGLRGMERAG